MDAVHIIIVHDGAGNWIVAFIDDDGEAVLVKVMVKVNDDAVTSDHEVVSMKAIHGRID